MTYFENKQTVNLMVWETVEKKRNINNIIKFYIDKKVEIKKGDVIIGTYNTDFMSSYEIEEIKEVRDGTISNQSYITASTVWNHRPMSDLKGSEHKHVSSTLLRAVK